MQLVATLSFHILEIKNGQFFLAQKSRDQRWSRMTVQRQLPIYNLESLFRSRFMEV